MTSRSRILLLFLSGALLSAVVTAMGVLHWHQPQSQLLWTTALHQSVQELRRVDQKPTTRMR